MPAKFLVVDDEPDVELLIRHRFRRQIRAGEYEFVFASNGYEALERLTEHEDVQVVLSDINMPKMDGLTLLGALAGLDRPLKVVIVSAYGDLANIRTAMNRGAFDFLTKPLDFDDLDATIEKSLREVEALRQARRLQQQMGILQRDLDIARRIQLSMLPNAFPERADLGLHALALPAKEVGGDFYDFLELGPARLGFLIGDVAGKGLGAALFMAITRTVMHATAPQGLPVGDYVRQVNRLLAAEADRMPSMFVTALYGEVDGRTGTVTFCNAGHNLPVLRRADGTATFLEAPRGLSLCLAPDFAFQTAQVTLQPGDTLFLYTDGVTEAFNAEREEFSDERLTATVSAAPDAEPRALLQYVLREVQAFVDGAPQSDDVTMLALQFRGNGHAHVDAHAAA